MNRVPYRITYDNLKTTVKKALQGSSREEQEQFIALRTHNLYEFPSVAIALGNEEGGVENPGKLAVRSSLPPIHRC